MIWAIVQQVGGQAASYAVFFLLAAILRPQEFGIVGMASAWIGLLGAFAEIGFGAAIVQRSQIRSEHLSTTFAINMVGGVVLAAVGAVLAWTAADFFGTPAVGPVMAVLSIGFIIRAISLTQAAYAQRELRFRALAGRDIVASLVGGLAGVASALLGWGVWSLVAMTLVNNVVGAILIWRTTDWRPRWGEVSLVHARELWPFSSRILGFNILKALVQNIDRLVIGFLLGAHALGIYTFAWRVVVFPVRLLSSAMGAYLFPKASRLQHDIAAARAQYVTMMALLLSVVVPAMVAEVQLAPLIVTEIFGAKWAAAVLPMQVLSVTALAGAFYPLAGDLVKAMNRPGWMVAWSALYAGVSGGVLWLGARHGLIGAVIAMSAAHTFLLPVVFYMVDRVVGLRWREVFARWLPSVAGSVVLASAIWTTLRFTPLPSLSRAAVALLLGLAGYAVVLGYLDPELGRRLSGRPAPGAQLAGVNRGRK